jgi:hypothetical protein
MTLRLAVYLRILLLEKHAYRLVYASEFLTQLSKSSLKLFIYTVISAILEPY